MRGKLAAMVCLLALFALPCCAGASETPTPSSYDEYWRAHADAPVIAEQIAVFACAEGVQVPLGGEATVTITVPESCFAYPVLAYEMTADNILDNVTALRVDGETPYIECAALSLDADWLTPESYPADRYGNEVVGMPVKVYAPRSQGLMGRAALYSRGMGLYLQAGEHTLTFSCSEGPFVLYGVTLAPSVSPPADAEATVSGSALIAMEAERVNRRNNPNIRPAAEYDAALTPYSSKRKVINYIEDLSYRYAGDRLEFDFTVETEGWYGLALRMRQAEKANMPVFRTFCLDGVIPSESFENAAFAFDQRFGNQIVKTPLGGVASFYLTPGAHTLCIQTSLDPLREAIAGLTAVSDEIAALALEVSKITGGNTDFFRDFSLADFDIDASAYLADWIDRLEALYAGLVQTCGGVAAGEVSGVRVAIEMLSHMLEKPDDLPKRLSELSTGTSSARACLVAVVTSLNESPMGLDGVYFFQNADDLPREKSVIEKLSATIGRFAASFGAQEYAARAAGDGDRLQIWVNRPRQYLEILQRMTDAQFTPETGIAVDFSIMPDQNKLILANASGGAPDAAVAISAGLTYDLAVRGALKNMREYADFKEIASRFPTGLLMPGVCDDGLYALPETFNFCVLFYRKDILESLSLPLPDTMDEVLAMLPTLRRYGLNFNNYVANAVGYKGLGITTPYIYQCGGALYEGGSYLSALGGERALRGLKLLTDSFIVYDMDYEINSFYQSFRDGTLPIGTSNYGMYNLLMNAAPELAGRWGIAVYPGVKDETGRVLRYTSGAAESSVIFSSSRMQDEAWRFLSWYMSAPVQTEFAYTLQATLGNEYLWNSANLEAFRASPWPAEDKAVIAEQLEWTYEAPRTLGVYMVERELSNAVNAIVLDGKNLRAAMDEAILRIDREVTRKLEEFGRIKNGELTAPFVTLTLDDVKEWLR